MTKANTTKETGMETGIEEQVRKMQEAYLSLLPENVRNFWETMGMLPKQHKQENKEEKVEALPEKVSLLENDSVVKTMLKQVEINKKMTGAYLLYLEATEDALRMMTSMEKLFPYNLYRR